MATTDESKDLQGIDDALIDELDAENIEDSLTFSNGVIEKIVALSLHDVSGLVDLKGGFLDRVQGTLGMSTVRKGVTITVTPENTVVVTVAAIMAYGSYAPQIFEDAKQAIVRDIVGMTGLEVSSVNLRIEDIYTPEEIEAQHPQLPSPEPYGEIAGELPE